MSIFISKATLSISRACPKCGQAVSRDSNIAVECACKQWTWEADAVGQVVSISAGIEGKSSTL